MGTATIIIVAIHKLVIVLIIRCNTADLEGGFIPFQRHHFLNNHTTLITLTDTQTHGHTHTVITDKGGLPSCSQGYARLSCQVILSNNHTWSMQ